MFDQHRISRRNFLKLNAIVGSALAITVALPAAAAASAATPLESAGDDMLSHTPVLRFGTPTDVAATWHGDAWSVDAEGVIRTFDRAKQVWVLDTAEGETDFPAHSQLVLARWGRPAGPNQMLMVLSRAG